MHLEQLDKVFARIQSAGLRINAKKSFFGKSELEYLRYWVSRDGIKPVPKKVQAIVNLKPPKHRKRLESSLE